MLLKDTESAPELAAELFWLPALDEESPAEVELAFLLTLSALPRTALSEGFGLPYCEIASVIRGSLSAVGPDLALLRL